jgi:undecaprenyl-diphosphatase
MHAATALSTVVIFWKEIGRIFRGLFRFKWNEETQYSFKIVLSMLPAGFVGIVFKEEIEQLFEGQLLLVGAMLIITGLLLFLADKAKKTEKSVSYPNAIIIGIAQAIAILPGISRSGATISTSVLLGVDRSKAAQFSFLMVVPLILGAFILDLKDLIGGEAMAIQQISMTPLIIGFIGAFFSGLLACKWMIELVKRSKLVYFSIYCFAVGIIATFLAIYI